MLNVAVYAATAAGLKATYTAQLAAGASEGPHVVSSTKSVGFVPASAMELKVKVAVPLLVSVTASAAEVVKCVVAGKARVVTLWVSAGAAVPVPVSVTFCGEPVAESVTLNVPVSAAAEAGLNETT